MTETLLGRALSLANGLKPWKPLYYPVIYRAIFRAFRTLTAPLLSDFISRRAISISSNRAAIYRQAGPPTASLTRDPVSRTRWKVHKLPFNQPGSRFRQRAREQRRQLLSKYSARADANIFICTKVGHTHMLTRDVASSAFWDAGAK